MTYYLADRQPEPVPLAQAIRDLLDEANVLYEPFHYHIHRRDLSTLQGYSELAEPPPTEVEVEIRFRVQVT